MHFRLFLLSVLFLMGTPLWGEAQVVNPTNECSNGAIPTLNLNTAGDYTNRTVSVPASHTASAGGLPSCSPGLATPSQDSWFKVTSNLTGTLAISYTPLVSAQDIALAVYSDNCGTLSLLQCANRYTGGSPSFFAFASLHTETALVSAVAGTTYLVRLMNLSVAANTAYTGNLSVYSGYIPTRDLCVNSVGLTIGSCNFPLNVENNHFHNESRTGTFCGDDAYQDVWAEIPFSANKSIKVTYKSTNYDASIGLYRGANCGSLSEVLCRDVVNGAGEESFAYNFPSSTTDKFYIRVANAENELTLTGTICIEEVVYRDQFNDVDEIANPSFPSAVRLGDCGVKISLPFAGYDEDGPNTCNTASGAVNLRNVWLKYVPTADNVGSLIQVEFYSTNGGSAISMAVLKSNGGTPISALNPLNPSTNEACVTAIGSETINTNFLVEVGETYYIGLYSDDFIDVEGAFCMYEHSRRAEDLFYTARKFEITGADCGNIFNVFKTFEPDGVDNSLIPVPVGVSTTLCTPAVTSSIDAWGSFQTSGTIATSGYALEYNNQDTDSGVSTDDVAVQVFIGGNVQTAGAVSNTTCAGATGGTSINTNASVYNVNINNAATGTAPAPSCLAGNVINRETWVRYTSTGTQNFVVIYRNTDGKKVVVQVLDATLGCGGLVEAGCANNVFSTEGISLVTITNTVAGKEYVIRLATIETTNVGATSVGELSVSDASQLTNLACENSVGEGTETLILSAGILSTNKQYYFRIVNTNTNMAPSPDVPRTVQGRVCLRANDTPLGDLCANAQTLMVGDCDVDFNIETNFTANQSLSDALPASCALPAANAWRDAWATFTATSNNTSVEYTQAAGATTDIQIEIFRGTCGSLTRVAVWNKSDQCTDLIPVNTAGDEKYQFTTVSGSIYFIRIINLYPNPVDGKICIYNTVERDVCDDNDLSTRIVGECNLPLSVPATFDTDLPVSGMVDPAYRNVDALPIVETGSTITQTVRTVCENPIVNGDADPGTNNPSLASAKDAWLRIIGNGNDITLYYETRGTNAPNPSIAIYTALKSVGPVHCGTGLSGANNPENQYACANNVNANQQQTESVTFATNAGQEYLVRIINLNGGMGSDMTGLFCIADGRNDYKNPCTSSATPPRAVEIGQCSVPLHIEGKTSPICADPTNENNAYEDATANNCDDCKGGDAWATVTRPYVCDPTATLPTPKTGGGTISCYLPHRVNLGTDNAIGGTGTAEDKCECGTAGTNNCGTGTIPAPTVLHNTNGVCPYPYSYDNRGTVSTADDRCICALRTSTTTTGELTNTTAGFTVTFDNRNGISYLAPDANILVYQTTNCSNENNYTRIGCDSDFSVTTVLPAPSTATFTTGEGVRSILISGLPKTHGSGGETYLIRVVNQSTTGKSVFGTLCLYHGNSLGSSTCPNVGDYGAIEGDFRNFDVAHDGGSPPSGESEPTTTIASCVTPLAGTPSTMNPHPIRADEWVKVTVPADASYNRITVQYDNTGFSTQHNAAVAVYSTATGAAATNCQLYNATTNAGGLILKDCINSTYIGSETITVTVTAGHTYYVRIMNVQSSTNPGTMKGQIRIYPFVLCNLGTELVSDGSFSAWSVITYPSTVPTGSTAAAYDAARANAVLRVPKIDDNAPYPNDLDGVWGKDLGTLTTINTGVAHFATDYGYQRDLTASGNGVLPLGGLAPNANFEATFSNLADPNARQELNTEGMYSVRQSPWSLKDDWFGFGAGYSGYGGRAGRGEPVLSYCQTGGGGFGKEPCSPISIGYDNVVTNGTYHTAIQRSAVWPFASDANFLMVNGSYNPSGNKPPGKVWCQTLKRPSADVGDISYYILTFWAQNPYSIGTNKDVPQIRMTVCDMEDPANPEVLPTKRDVYTGSAGDTGADDQRLTVLPGITDAGLTSTTRFPEEHVMQQVRHIPKPSNNRIAALPASGGSAVTSYGAASTCNLTTGNGYTGADNKNETANARLKVLGGTYSISEDPDKWVAVRCIYRAPRPVEEMNVCIENFGITGNDNDLFIDVISFRKCENATAEVFEKMLKSDPCELSNNGTNIGVPLPASLLEFSGSLVGDKVLLNWLAMNEIETSHYRIERSVDGYSFKGIGNTDAKGVKDGGYADYSYLDFNLPFGVKYLYYRLVIVDRNGLEHIGSVIAVGIEGQSNLALLLKPNPTNAGDEVTLSFYSPTEGKAIIQVTDLMGVRLMQKTADVKIGDNESNLSTRGLKTGLYVVRLLLNGKVATQKLVVR